MMQTGHPHGKPTGSQGPGQSVAMHGQPESAARTQPNLDAGRRGPTKD